MRLQIERKNVMVEKEKRLGNQDPTQSVILPFSKSLSDEAIAIYEKTGLQSYP